MKKKIVVVDDFKTNTIVVAGTLKLYGYDVLQSNNPVEALDFFDGQTIDLIISDFKMPQMTGAEFIKKIKKIPKYRNVPVIILSSETGAQSRQEAREAGAYGWLQKPFDIDRFIKIVNSIFK